VIAQWTFNALLVILAVVLVAVFGAARLSRKSASQMPVLVASAEPPERSTELS
jgi:hypothetical protein